MIRSCDNTSQNSNGKTDSYQISIFFNFFYLNWSSDICFVYSCVSVLWEFFECNSLIHTGYSLLSRTALHPRQVSLFLVNIASLLTFDVTIVFVSVCCPSAKISNKGIKIRVFCLVELENKSSKSHYTWPHLRLSFGRLWE